MDTLGGTCWSSSFILGTRLTGADRDPLLAGGGRPVGLAKGGAAKMDVKEGEAAANDDDPGAVAVALVFGLGCCDAG